jgi:flagellar hook-associated protein 3 FlgL
MVSRIATFANTNLLIQASMNLQAKLTDEQTQEASGVKTTSFSGLKGDAGKLLDLQGQVTRLQAESDLATSAAADVQSAYSAVGNITDLATTVRTQLSAALSNTSSTTPMITAADAQGWLQTLQSELNTEVGGQYVFSGQAVDRAPVNFSNPAYTPTTDPTTADTSYFTGTDTTRQLKTSTGTTIGISVSADSSGFEKLARALSMIQAAPTDKTQLSAAYDLATSALNDLGTTQATLSNQAAALDTVSTDNTTKITTLKNLAGDLTGSDLSTAAVMGADLGARRPRFSVLARLIGFIQPKRPATAVAERLRDGSPEQVGDDGNEWGDR